MKFYYIIPAYNEESQLRRTFQEISEARKTTNIEILIVDNASTDRTWETAQALSQENPTWVSAYREEKKGLGVAFMRGLRELQKRQIENTDWAVYCAADLPFGFTDLKGVLSQDELQLRRTILYVGSKRHPQSKVVRHWKRVLGSNIFEFLRWILLGLKTKDTQGSLFLRGDFVSLVEKMRSEDYFFSVELVYFAEREGQVVELPVTNNPEIRPSRLSLVRDGLKTIHQLLKFRKDLKSR